MTLTWARAISSNQKAVLIAAFYCLCLHAIWLLICSVSVANTGEVSLIWFVAKWLVPVLCALIGVLCYRGAHRGRLLVAALFFLFSWLAFDPTTRIGAMIGWQFNESSEDRRMLWDGSLEFKG
ncbi:hypothetical protein shim_30430 [Shimia sp. SK013]|nr:hypothetical protein shim_30430 [Shimia sp. SK013]